MSNFFWKFFGEKKRKSNLPDANQSMIDLIFENHNHDDSFRSHQPHIDRSFSLPDDDLHHPTDRAESFNDLPSVIGSRTNIVSVFNSPRRVRLNFILFKLSDNLDGRSV
jgi:hypothetical protein